MGQFAQQCGIVCLRNRTGLNDDDNAELFEFQEAAIEINDNTKTTREEKEALLTDLLAAYGHTLIIEGEYLDSKA
jgi:hypothetical protein